MNTREFLTAWIVLATWCLALVQGSSLCLSPDPAERDRTAVDIRCKSDHVMYNLNVTASDDVSCGVSTSTCTGKSPDLIMQTNNCLWKNACQLPFPYMKLITSEPLDGENTCYYKRAASLKVGNVKCMPNAHLSMMCGVQESVPHKSGLIRSHAYYPWFYDSSELFPGNKSCRRRFDLAALLDNSQILVVEIQMLTLCDSEELILTTTSGEEMIGKDTGVTRKIYNRHDRELVVSFSGHNESCGCEGFLLCYKSYDVSKAADSISVCEDLSSPPQVLVNTTSLTSQSRDRDGWPIADKDAEVAVGGKETIEAAESSLSTTEKPNENRRNGKKGRGGRKGKKDRKNRKKNRKKGKKNRRKKNKGRKSGEEP